MAFGTYGCIVVLCYCTKCLQTWIGHCTFGLCSLVFVKIFHSVCLPTLCTMVTYAITTPPQHVVSLLLFAVIALALTRPVFLALSDYSQRRPKQDVTFDEKPGLCLACLVLESSLCLVVVPGCIGFQARLEKDVGIREVGRF